MRTTIPVLAGILASMMVSCQKSTEPSTPRESASSQVSGRILDDEGNPISGALVVSIVSRAKTTTDDHGAWSLPRSGSGGADTFQVMVDSVSAGRILLPFGKSQPGDAHLAWRPVNGSLYFIYRAYAPKIYRVRLIVVRRNGDRDTLFSPIDSIVQRFSARFPHLIGDSSNFGFIVPEIVDAKGAAARGDTVYFTGESKAVPVSMYFPRNLEITTYLGATWRYRDTSRVTAWEIDTSLLAKIEWSTSLDTNWRIGPNSILVTAPSGTDSPLTVRIRLTSRESRVDTQSIAFQPKASNPYAEPSRRIPTPPRLTASLPSDVPLGDTFTISSKASDTLGGKVVSRKLAWAWGDTIDLLSDLQTMVFPRKKTGAILAGQVFAVDDDGESTFVSVSMHVLEPAPTLTISDKTTRSFRVSWDSAFVAGHDKIRIRVRDGIDDTILLIDSLVDAGLRTLSMPRRFLPTDLLFEARFEGSASDTGLWILKKDSLPSDPFNPFWLRIYPDWLYFWTWVSPGQSTYGYGANTLPLVPQADTTLIAFYGKELQNPLNYPSHISWNQTPHIRDSLIIDFEAVDTVVVRIVCGPGIQDGSNYNTLGWKPRKVKSGREVFRLSELSVLKIEWNQNSQITTVVPDSLTSYPPQERAALARKSRGIGVSFECEESEAVCDAKRTAVLVPSLEIR